MAGDILVVDDEEDIRNLAGKVLRNAGYEVRTASNAREVTSGLSLRRPSLMLLDLWLEKSHEDGLRIFRELNRRQPQLPIVLISGYGTLEIATEAIREGAMDFIPKPFSAEILLDVVRRALNESLVLREHREIMASFGGRIDRYDGSSQKIKNLTKVVNSLADKPKTRVLINGEAGTGKAATAWMIHLKSLGRDSPFITVQCGEKFRGRHFAEAMFGAESGGRRRLGALEKAHGGSMVMRHVDALSPTSQQILLQAFQRKKFQRLGSSSLVDANFRVMATSRVNLQELAQAGKFSTELYHRLGVLTVNVPSLSGRRKDIPEIACSILERSCGLRGWPPVEIEQQAQDWLSNYNWWGNIWQLRMVLEEALNLAQGAEVLGRELLQRASQERGGIYGRIGQDMARWYRMPLKEAKIRFEREYLQHLMERCQNNVSEAARIAKFERASLHRKLSKLRVYREDHKHS